jgi:hypothetical protein
VVLASPTKQELVTGTRITNSTKSSNLLEKIYPYLFRRTDYNQRMNSGTLNFNSTLSKVQNSLKSVPWTFSKDGLLRSGDSLMIKNKKVNGYLAADVGSKQAGVDNAFIINASK